MSLTTDELYRYRQQLKLDNIGIEGQLKLKNTKMVCVGAGGLGSSLLLYLAAAGIGTIGIVDDDVIELSNLQRQVLYKTAHLGYKKVAMAKEQLMALNPHLNIQIHETRLTLKNAKKLIAEYDIIADCSDNFETRYLINDVCFHLNKPYVFASISQYEGHCSLFLGQQGPCLRCLFPTLPAVVSIPNCTDGGVLGVLPGLLGIIQATEIIKWILTDHEVSATQLFIIDILKMSFRQFSLTQNPECKLCALHQPVEVLAQTNDLSRHAISVNELQNKLNTKENIQLLDVRSKEEHEVYNLGRLLIPLPELLNRLSELNPAQPIIIYCQSGQRSMQALKILMDANFNSVKYLQGGISEWIRSKDSNVA